MNTQDPEPMRIAEARLIVAAASSSDLADPRPELVAALELLRRDPAEWARVLDQRQFDQAVSAAFRTLEPPPGLKAEILAAHAAQRRSQPRRRFLLAWAAGLVVVGGGVLSGVFWNRNRARPVLRGVRVLAADAAHFLDREWDHVFEHSASSLPALQTYLGTDAAGGSMEPGGRFGNLATIGCRRFPWRGQTAVLVCFQGEGATTVIHVVSVPKAAMEEEAAGGLALFREGRWHAAAWYRGERAYVALSDQLLDAGLWGPA